MIANSKPPGGLSRRFATHANQLAVLLIVATVAGLLLDSQFQFLSQLPARTVKGLGKSMGEGALNAAFLALAYYVGREVLVLLRKRGVLDAKGIGEYLVSGLAILRSIHPLAGTLAVSLALLHAYIMLFVWTGFIGQATINGGLVALAAIGLVAVLGVVVRLVPAKMGARVAHRYGAALFIAAYAIHKLYLR